MKIGLHLDIFTQFAVAINDIVGTITSSSWETL